MTQVGNKNIDNASGQVVRLDIQNTLQTVATHNFGARDNAGTILPCEFLADDTTNKLLIRKSSGGNQAKPTLANGNPNPDAATFFEVGDLDSDNLGLLPKSGGALTGVLQLPVGSVTAPSLHFGQTNTGIFKGASHRVSFTSAGTQVFYVDSTGININSSKEVRWKDSNNTQYIGFKAPSNITSNFTLTLPTADGSSGQALITDGSGTLSFGSAISAAADLTGNTLASGVTASSLTSVGTLTSLVTGSINIKSNTPTLNFTDDDHNTDFRLRVNSNGFRIQDTSDNNSTRFLINSAGVVDIPNTLQANKAQVDSIIPRNGLPSGSSGGIIQIKQTFKTDHFSVTSAAYVAITGMTITISPQSSSSKILLEVVMNASGRENHYGGVRVMRTIGSGTAQHIGVSTAVAINNATQDQENASFGIGVNSGHNADLKLKTYGFKILDEPTTTDDVTYALEVFAVNGSDAAVQFDLNRPSNVRLDTNGRHFVGATSSMTAYEVTA